MDNIGIIKETFENQINKTVYSIHKFENVPNNQVFKVETASRPYVFKIYSKRDWPEDGKPPFVNQKLGEYKIPHAKLIMFNRNDNNFPNGYLIEEYLPGITADRLILSEDDTLKLFDRLAVLVSRVHQIRLMNYGYIGSGVSDYTTFSEFMHDVLKDNIPNLTASSIINTFELETINEKLYTRLKLCDTFPSVLCHGDLSTKNILVNSDEITLIDWDDAQSLCWMADIARLTLWMKLNYSKRHASIYRKAFLDRYETTHDKNAFYEMEDTLHVWYGLDYLTFFTEGPVYEKVKIHLQDSRKKCGI